jgi:hypothetical protein
LRWAFGVDAGCLGRVLPPIDGDVVVLGRIEACQCWTETGEDESSDGDEMHRSVLSMDRLTSGIGAATARKERHCE